MCSIAGEVNYSGNIAFKSLGEEVKASMERRGPDDYGNFTSDHVVLYHTRLAVMDPDNGKQPMKVNALENEYTIVYNGELYNSLELKSDLKKVGFTFTSNCDTEVLLKSFIYWKEECLEHFNGIYAFAIWDKNKDELFVARDKMGVKPFFYTMEKKRFLFSSEIKTLMLHPSLTPTIDRDGIAEIFFLGPGRTPGYGVFRGVKELKPGYCGKMSREGFKVWKYWDVIDGMHEEDFEHTVNHVGELVVDAIERQLVSDVPIGTFLSGGLDSSIISSVASKYLKSRGEKLTTFSVNYKDNSKYFKSSHFQPNSDVEYIKQMVEYLDSNHIEVVLDTKELIDSLYKAVDARDLPGMADVDSSLLLFCKEVKKHVTVALSGECADEIFGGYPWFRDKDIRSQYGFPWSQSTVYRSIFLKKNIQNKLVGTDYVNGKYEETIKAVPKLVGLSKDEERMREMVYLNMKWFMQTLLDRKDRMSMYSGLEVRVPFCDYRIAQYLYSTPWEMKDYMFREKGLLREAMIGWLPESILWRKKSPYPKTQNPTYLNQVSKELGKILQQQDAPIFSLCEPRELEKLLHNDRTKPWYGQLMTTPQTIAYFLQINYWLEKYNVKIDMS